MLDTASSPVTGIPVAVPAALLVVRRRLKTRKLWLVGLANLGVVGWKEIDNKEVLAGWFSKSGCC